MEGHLPLDTNGLNCPLDISNNKLFFSLVDYRNNYFTSNDPNKIVEFYKSFENRDQLIEWMKERPGGTANIYEIEGGEEIIVVIPTADFNGKYAKECRENVFKGLHIIFVESGKEDYYFNYAHNCNVGIKKAMEYNPKWIVVSNDDAYEISEVENLKEELSKKDPNEIDLLFAKEMSYITQHSQLAERRIIFKIILFLIGKSLQWNRLEKRFKIRYLGAPTKGLSFALYKKGWTFSNLIAFAIFSSNMCTKLKGDLFDETYINAAEDTDLSIRANTEYRSEIINYKIGAFKGKTMGMGKMRRYREIPSNAYLNLKIELGLLKIGPHSKNLK
ncbi:MAG: hypothetical protein M1113_02845 [Candidatus Thermoplasmatota archaeon]|nr:hypothetical protein [Candidatus Thermoplasmatota archaeon]